MAQRQYQMPVGGSDGNGKGFPSEADGDFDVVPKADIVAWREKLNARFGIGSGKLKVVEDPFRTN